MSEVLFNEAKTILIFCEESGAFADLYRAAGYKVIVREIKLDGPDGNAVLTEYIKGGIYGFIAHPVCTLGTISRNNTTAKEKAMPPNDPDLYRNRYEERLCQEYYPLVDACFRIPTIYRKTLKFWMIEQPITILPNTHGPYRMAFNPNEFAGYADDPSKEAYTKKTCLWGEFNKPKKKWVHPVLGSLMHTAVGGKSAATKEFRSKNPTGFVRAFFEANQ